MRSEARWLPLLGCALALACARSQVALSVMQRHPFADQEAEFWDDLGREPVVCNEDALHALLLLAGEAEDVSYARDWAHARARGWVAGGNPPPARAAVRYGLVARAACELLGLRGGLGMMLWGYTERACVRELAFREIAPQRSPGRTLSGPELVELVSRLEREQEDEGP